MFDFRTWSKACFKMKFLFCCLASPGYVNPAVGIALQLCERGHEVAFVTDIACSELLSRQGLRRIPLGAVDGSSFQVPRWFDAPSVALQMKHISFALTQFQPDVLVGQQFTFGPLLIGQHRHIPVGIFGLFCFLWPAHEPDPGATLSLTQQTHLWRHKEMLGSYNQVRTLLGFRPIEATCQESPLLGDAFFLRNIPEIQDAADLPERVHLVGDCLWEENDSCPEVDAWLEAALAAKSPIVYVHHAREFDSPNFWPAIAALAEKNIRVAASVGRMDRKPTDIPPTFFVRDHVPQTRVLRHASAMIGSASTTAVLGALTNGVPCVFLSRNSSEEPDVAAACQAAGVAKMLPAQSSSSQIAEELRHAIGDPEMQQVSRRIASSFAGFDGRNRAASLLEELGETKAPLSRSLVDPGARQVSL